MLPDGILMSSSRQTQQEPSNQNKTLKLGAEKQELTFLLLSWFFLGGGGIEGVAFLQSDRNRINTVKWAKNDLQQFTSLHGTPPHVYEQLKLNILLLRKEYDFC